MSHLIRFLNNIITTLTLLHHNHNIQLIKTMFQLFLAYPLATAGVPPGVRVPPVENRWSNVWLLFVQRESTKFITTKNANIHVAICSSLPAVYVV